VIGRSSAILFSFREELVHGQVQRVCEAAGRGQVRHARPKRSDAKIVAADTPDRSASSGRDMPAVRRTNSSVVSGVVR
jgi:hypothetical protein